MSKDFIKKIAYSGPTKQHCDNCKKLFIILKESPTNMELCFNCYAVMEGSVEAAKIANQMSDYQSELWEKALPYDFEQLVQKRAIKKELFLSSNSTEGDGGLLIDHLTDKLGREVSKELLEAKSRNEVVESERFNELFQNTIAELDEYPELTDSLRTKIISIIKENYDRGLKCTKHMLK